MQGASPAGGAILAGMVTARFHFHHELNDFLARSQRGETFACAYPDASSVKHIIEALGVPHTEVELVVRNGAPSTFDVPIREDDVIEVYPTHRLPAGMESGAALLRPPLRAADLRFIADAHLGGLAQLLRLAGFDTRYDNHFADDEIERLANAEARIVLSRDRELLKRRTLLRGCYVRALQPDAQFREIATQLDLALHVRAFWLCLMCKRRCVPRARTKSTGACPKVCASATRASSPAMSVAACSGKGRTGSA